MKLYHGTTSKYLPTILRDGLLPRNTTGQRSNWKEHPSADDRVYLTDAYAIFFAYSAADEDERGLIVEVEVDEGEDFLVPDEDVLAQAEFSHESFAFLHDMSMKERTIWWKVHAPNYPELWKDSLQRMGTVAVMGGAGPEQITGAWSFPINVELLLEHDPCISLMNYRICGDKYREQLQEFIHDPARTKVEKSYVQTITA